MFSLVHELQLNIKHMVPALSIIFSIAIDSKRSLFLIIIYTVLLCKDDEPLGERATISIPSNVTKSGTLSRVLIVVTLAK